MKLTSATVLEGVAEALRDRIAPLIEDGFARDAARMAQSLILIAGRAGDDAAAIRVAENARMRAILAEGAAIVGDAALAERLSEAAQSSDPGLRIGELDAETGRLRLLLIELHVWLEGQDSAESRQLDREIWRAMRDFETARAPRA